MPDFPIMDRKPHFDDASWEYRIRRLFGAGEPFIKRKRIWTPRLAGPLDQGREGRCVIFGWGAELAATPYRHIVNDDWCNRNWHKVVAEDRKMGNNWSDGASVLAGAKAMKNEMKIRYYAWAFGINDVLETLVRKGPVILGVNWYDSMYYTDQQGLVKVSGKLVGGHCIMTNGYWPNHPTFKEDVVMWTNSWGPSYGINGRGYVRISDLDRLLREDGEACIPTDTPVRA
jgi:hypothetical protein